MKMQVMIHVMPRGGSLEERRRATREQDNGAGQQGGAAHKAARQQGGAAHKAAPGHLEASNPAPGHLEPHLDKDG